MKHLGKECGIDRRTFLKYSLGATGGLMLGSGPAGFLRVAGAAVPGEKVQKFVYSTTSRHDFAELARLVALSFKEIGIDIEIEVLELGSFLRKAMESHETVFSGMSWTGSSERIDPSFYLTEFFHSKNAMKGGRNYQHYRNPAYDKVCDAANTEMDPEKRVKLVHQCQEMLAEDYAMWTVGFPDILNAYNSEDWEGPVGSWGCGVGGEYEPWTWLNVKPKTKRTKIVTCNVNPLDSFSLGTRSGNARANIRMIYDTFLKLDATAKVIPWAAQSWRIVSGTVVDIVLREGMKFHDGRPVSIEDVKFTFDYMKDRNMAMYRSVYDLIEKTEVMDNNTFRFHLVKPYAPFISNSLTYAHILPKHIWKDISDPNQYPNEHPIGNGPFKFGYWKRRVELHMEANKEHFHAPKIDGFYRKVIPSMEGVIAALETKEVDIAHDRLSSEQAEKLAKISHISVVAAPNHGAYELRGDLDQKPFSDLSFRKAVSYSVPRREFMELVFGNAGHPAANTIIHPKLEPWYNKNVPFNEYSVAEAKKILQKAGYTWDKKGSLHHPS